MVEPHPGVGVVPAVVHEGDTGDPLTRGEHHDGARLGPVGRQPDVGARVERCVVQSHLDDAPSSRNRGPLRMREGLEAPPWVEHAVRAGCAPRPGPAPVLLAHVGDRAVEHHRRRIRLLTRVKPTPIEIEVDDPDIPAVALEARHRDPTCQRHVRVAPRSSAPPRPPRPLLSPCQKIVVGEGPMTSARRVVCGLAIGVIASTAPVEAALTGGATRMASSNPTPLQSALRRLLGDRDHEHPSAPGVRRRARMRPPSSVAQREMDWFRRGQGLPYWHHDRRSD